MIYAFAYRNVRLSQYKNKEAWAGTTDQIPGMSVEDVLKTNTIRSSYQQETQKQKQKIN